MFAASCEISHEQRAAKLDLTTHNVEVLDAKPDDDARRCTGLYDPKRVRRSPSPDVAGFAERTRIVLGVE
jgi:hypothetical protein